jgi:hypothetical protein
LTSSLCLPEVAGIIFREVNFMSPLRNFPDPSNKSNVTKFSWYSPSSSSFFCFFCSARSWNVYCMHLTEILHFVLFTLHHHYHHHYYHVHEVLGVFPVPWSSKWNWSLHLFLGRPMFLRPFGLYCNACYGILFVSIESRSTSSFWGRYECFDVPWVGYRPVAGWV